MHDRIRKLREEKKLSRAAFGEKLGVSGDVINNLERGRVEPKDHIIKLICAEFSVNEEWLRNGDGPIYIEPDTFSLDNLAALHHATDIDLQIVKTYFELPEDVRTLLIQRFANVFFAPAADSTEEITVEDAEELYKKSVLSSAQKTDSTVSSSINDIEKKVANEK